MQNIKCKILPCPFMADVSHHSCVLFNDNLYIFGGFSNYTRHELHKLSLKTLKWEVIKPKGKPPSMYDHTSIVYKNTMITYGGTGGDSLDAHRVDVYNFTNNRWEIQKCKGKVPKIRPYNHTAVLYDSKMIVFGGFYGAHITNHLYELCLSNFTWNAIENYSGIIPPAVESHEASIIGDEMYVFGGSSSMNIYAYHLLLNKWREIVPLYEPHSPNQFVSYSLVGSDERIFVLGGLVPRNGLWEYNLITNKFIKREFEIVNLWENEKTSFPLQLSAHTAVKYKNSFIVIGGYNGFSRQHIVYQFMVDFKDTIFNDRMIKILEKKQFIDLLFVC